MAPKSAKRRRTPSPSASATAKRTKFDLDIAATPPGQKRQNLEHQHDESEVDHPEGPAVSLFLQDNTDLPVQQQQAKPDSQHYNYVTRSDRNNSNKNMRAPSSLPHRIGFMDLPGELRSRIYEYVNEEMATTPDTPINLSKNIKHLTFDTHCINKVWTCEVVRLARVMIALEFKGSPRVIGVQYQIDIVYKGIMRASTAYRDGYATRQLVRLSTKLTIFSVVSMQVSTPSIDLLISVDLIENLTLEK
ncbi:hypothetical protein SLS56_010529 [Neofusicoccum ribis]|uniref:Uncharacterized protein n=1 Tax=Neofusicoccum ribis TaxID=45134 RepID=A0ABR3SE70_9PEZI